MEVSLAARPRDLGYSAAATFQPTNLGASSTARIEAVGASAALVSFSFADVYKSLSITAQEALQRLQNFVSDSGEQEPVEAPEGALTPQRTADLITEGVVAAYQGYVSAQSPEASRAQFFEKTRDELAEAFESARKALDASGAFENPAVEKSFAETRQAVDSSVNAFAAYVAEG